VGTVCAHDWVYDAPSGDLSRSAKEIRNHGCAHDLCESRGLDGKMESKARSKTVYGFGPEGGGNVMGVPAGIGYHGNLLWQAWK
jgi:hypothetical protein